MSLKNLWSTWNDFWFGEGSPLPVALFRIAIGLLVVYFTILFSPEAGTFFGQHAIVQPETTGNWMHAPELNVLTFLPPDDVWLYRLLVLLAISGLCLALGVFSRLSAFICFLLILSLDSRNHFVLHTGDKIMCESLLYLVFSRCGETLSFKRLWQVWRLRNPDFGPVKNGSLFGQRLIQVQLAIVYWGAFTSKLHGKTWMDGTAVYFAAHLIQFQRFQVPYLLDQLWASKLLTWGTLVLEFSLCFLIWIKEFRYPLLLAGVIFHLGLDWVMVIPLFQPIMLSCYLCFVDSADFAYLAAACRTQVAKLTGKPLWAFYDSRNGVSLRLAETIRRLDVLRLVNLENVVDSGQFDSVELPECPGVFVRAANGAAWQSSTGSARSLFVRLPLLLPVSGLLWLPGCESVLRGVGALLERIYGKPDASLSR